MVRPRLLPFLALFAACGGSSASTGGDAAEATGQDGTADDDDDDDGDENDDDTSVGTSADSTGTDVPAQNVPARGVRIMLVEANSGVAVPVARDGAWVDGPGRNAPMPKGRNTAFRVYVDVEEAGWVTRNIEARMTVTQSDGRETVYSESAEIAGDSSLTSLQSNILVGVVAEDILPYAAFQIELYEDGGDYSSLPEATEPPRAIDSGPGQIGIEASEQNMKVVLVPIEYDFGGCQATPVLDEAGLQPYVDSMYQQNPLETLEVEVASPLRVDDLDLTNGNGFFTLLNRIVQFRASMGVDSNVYVYALFDNCGACIGDGDGCLLGVAPGTPGDSQGEAGMRAAIGTQFLSGSEVGIETFVHEIGHTQGRAHIACPGVTSAGPDPSFPHENGSIGVWGFGVRDFGIRNPSNHKDYMSYCSPTWVSDWQWSATFNRIKSLTEWDTADVAPEPTGMQLMGTMNTETGESLWWTDRGHLADADVTAATSDVTMRMGEQTLHTSAAAIEAWSEGPWVTIRADLPDMVTIAATDSFELRTPTRTVSLPTSAIDFAIAGSLATP